MWACLILFVFLVWVCASASGLGAFGGFDVVPAFVGCGQRVCGCRFRWAGLWFGVVAGGFVWVWIIVCGLYVLVGFPWLCGGYLVWVWFSLGFGLRFGVVWCVDCGWTCGGLGRFWISLAFCFGWFWCCMVVFWVLRFGVS